MEELSIYIHIPFCVKKCLYCDFLSFPAGEVKRGMTERKTALSGSGTVQDDIEHYVNLLCREIMLSAEIYKKYQVISIFLGGGTPSLLPAYQISRIMEMVRSHYRVVENAEITMEMNPGTIDSGEPEQYITSGINRVSIGLQSADDEELRRIGRIHDYAAFLKTYDLVRGVGFRNVNVDIMAALPGQDTASYERTLRKVMALAPEHISAYSLILEEGTPLYERQSEYSFPTEEEEQEMDRITRQYLDSCGYHRYEISNYAKEGYECRHNKVYWQRGDYVGFGLGASSMVQNVRWSNPDTMENYAMYVTGAEAKRGYDGAEHSQFIQVNGLCGTEAGYIPHRQVLSRQEQMEEYMFLGLRMVCGVSAAKFEQIFGSPIEGVYGETIDCLRRQGLLVRDGDGIRLTERGLDVSNYAMAQFLFD
ncbi:MAG: radical SAM family heme chaperone HemW [Lachnospiraceae bacterium]|nr:radical SAM family heme chaperone HemW [Lachnospiraceae bacterium]